MRHTFKKRFSGQFLLIPNIICYFRILLVPVMVLLYTNGFHEYAFLALALSGLSDVVDGKIARLTNQVSDFGKLIDPVADKLTQLALMICVTVKHTVFAIPLALLVLKEIIVSIICIIATLKSDKFNSSRWYGKLCTVVLYASMTLTLFWFDIPEVLVYALTAACSVIIMLAMLLYTLFFAKILLSFKSNEKEI
ncbi:MAG: CDP-alcohol phosphatidyltransferase family protein [Ruminococcaceae bacterium]|nr:CDP-alcohol phosphatidyltransferase family protein [Oscillospiraceae bacterium]